MSSVFTTALLGSAVVVGSVLVGTLAQDATRTAKPCVGELCPRKSPSQNVPAQDAIQKMVKDANQGEQMQGEDPSSGQVIPRKKLGDPMPDQPRRSKNTGKVDKGIKTTAVVRTRADKKITATALSTANADKRTNALAVINEKADNRTNKTRALWPYERRN